MVFSKQIKISIITPLFNTPEKYLKELIDSVLDQTYSNWELCLADGSDIGINYAQKDSRIKYRKLDNNPGISGILNKAIEMSSGDFIGIMGHNDLLHPSALYEIMKGICQDNADFIYTDEAVFSNNRSITLKHHKPAYAADTLRSYNYINHFTIFDRKLMEQAGAFRTEFEGSHEYDLILRYTDIAKKKYHIPKILYFSRDITNNNGSSVSPAAEKAIKEHLEKHSISAHVKSKMGLPGFYRISYELTEKPLVSIIIPNKDNPILLQNCLSSIIEKTIYDNYEIIIVENNSTKKAVFKFYEKLKVYKNIKVVNWEGKGFNYSEICNYGARYAKAPPRDAIY
jgi:glycosyltransferase involved in cell wall biosynthesis